MQYRYIYILCAGMREEYTTEIMLIYVSKAYRYELWLCLFFWQSSYSEAAILCLWLLSLFLKDEHVRKPRIAFNYALEFSNVYTIGVYFRAEIYGGHLKDLMMILMWFDDFILNLRI